MNSSNSIYIRGWRGLSTFTGFHWKTLQRWHYQLMPIPFLKTHPTSRTARWVITPDLVHVWMSSIGMSLKDLKKVNMR